ncbi:hypothetical protein [Roseococcus pinisoli]|uniref:Uncharacterized protein n=1 Tax=Roseococcus pinisoli TaxID=2835040 RepID=A0ABS5QC39_9PROT|nr:hypothetical protein [Roseococcus pinisoli]MBS7810517.1 hypothetical protein [Roseococcus pinisoli]
MAIAIAWLPEATYAEFRKAQVDANNLPITWIEWKTRIEKQLSQFPASSLVRVEIKLEELQAFCAETGRRMDRDGRATFAAAVASGWKRQTTH